MAVLTGSSPAYQEGTWTPVFTFATPGNLSVTYSTQTGIYTRVGRLIVASFVIQTASYTQTTASGAAQITGLPFTSSGGTTVYGAVAWQGITKTNYTSPVAYINSASNIIGFAMGGSGQAQSVVVAADIPSGGNVYLAGTLSFVV